MYPGGSLLRRRAAEVEEALSADAFDFAAFCVSIGAAAKERSALRQDLVRGLKDYYETAYGYDRYGAETIFHLGDRMNEPYVYGFAVHRVLNDRRISARSKVGAARRAVDLVSYGADGGLPHGLLGAAGFLLAQQSLPLTDLRYVLVVAAGEYGPFRGLEKPEMLGFFDLLLALETMPAAEQAFWAHSLMARHQDQAGANDLVGGFLRTERLPREIRRECCQAWINFRQPRFAVDVPESDGTPRGTFVAEHMPFWIAHAPSWPNGAMIRQGLVWLAREGSDPLELAQTYLTYRDTYAEQFHGAVADILAEHHSHIPDATLRDLIESGIRTGGSVPTRRRFYRLGTEIFGAEYLARASGDSASSVRQWAARQLQRMS